MSSEIVRGVSVGLWILAGLAFLLSALFPRSSGAAFLGPLLLAGATLVTALSPLGTAREARGRPHWVLALLAVVIVLGVSLTIIREGDRRSFLYVLTIAGIALLLGFSRERR